MLHKGKGARVSVIRCLKLTLSNARLNIYSLNEGLVRLEENLQAILLFDMGMCHSFEQPPKRPLLPSLSFHAFKGIWKGWPLGKLVSRELIMHVVVDVVSCLGTTWSCVRFCRLQKNREMKRGQASWLPYGTGLQKPKTSLFVCKILGCYYYCCHCGATVGCFFLCIAV